MSGQNFSIDLQILRETMRWLHWPYLTMKNLQTREVAFVYDEPNGHRSTIYHANLIEYLADFTKEQRKNVSKTVYKDVLEMLNDGWRVD